MNPSVLLYSHLSEARQDFDHWWQKNRYCLHGQSLFIYEKAV